MEVCGDDPLLQLLHPLEAVDVHLQHPLLHLPRLLQRLHQGPVFLRLHLEDGIWAEGNAPLRTTCLVNQTGEPLLHHRPPASLTSDGLGAHLAQVLHVLGQVLVEHLLPDAPGVEGSQGGLQLLGVPDHPPAAHHRCRGEPESKREGSNPSQAQRWETND